MKMISLIRTVHRLIKIQIGNAYTTTIRFAIKIFLFTVIVAHYVSVYYNKNEFIEVTSNVSTMKLISLIRTVHDKHSRYWEQVCRG